MSDNLEEAAQAFFESKESGALKEKLENALRNDLQEKGLLGGESNVGDGVLYTEVEKPLGTPSEGFFALYCTEDGISLEYFDKEQALSTFIEMWAEDGYEIGFIQKIPQTLDVHTFPHEKGNQKFIMIIKGKVIVPQPEEVVVKWKIKY